jgi:signal transduction histidine kinase
VHHTRLRRQEEAQIAQLSSSRQRLLASADAQRARIATRLRVRVEEPVADLVAVLESFDRIPSGSSELVRTATAELADVATELRALSSGLRPPSLDSGGLTFALEELANKSALQVRVDNLRSGDFPPQLETAAYFVCAEALANATKHSHASAVDVTLDASPDALLLSIHDDGVGGADPSKGTGLLGLADRVAVLGGLLRVDSPVGAGTTITAELPMSADPQPRV